MDDLIDDIIIGRVRGLSAEFRPAILDDVGLVPAIQWLAERFEERAGIPCRLEWPSDSSVESLPLPRDRSIHVFRSDQEALTNVARHADAAEVCVTVERRDDAPDVTVRDGGVGADFSSLRRRDAFAVQGMRERAPAGWMARREESRAVNVRRSAP